MSPVFVILRLLHDRKEQTTEIFIVQFTVVLHIYMIYLKILSVLRIYFVDW
jgi:hypothetical protein